MRPTRIRDKKMAEYENLSFSEMQRLSESGDTEAMRKLAVLYINGDGVFQNLEKALELTMEAAERGNVEAMAETADIYRSIKKFEKSFEWEKKTAEQGRPASQYNLGHHYDKGIGTSQNEKQAFQWFKKAAENGYTDAKHSLAVCYLTGKGVPQDLEQGIYWLEQASNEGHAESKRRLGAAYIEGVGMPVDEEKGFSLLSEAASLGDETAKTLMREVSNGSSSSKTSNILYVIKDFFVIWIKIILFSIRDAFVFWWKITIRDFDFFRNNEDAPIWSRIIVFLSGITEFIFSFIKESWICYVLYFFLGYFASAWVAVFRILFSPITAIVRMINRK